MVNYVATKPYVLQKFAPIVLEWVIMERTHIQLSTILILMCLLILTIIDLKN